MIVPDDVRRLLERYLRGRDLRGRFYEHWALFESRLGRRLSTRQIRHLWHAWQRRAGIDPPHPFHALRHTYVTNLLAAGAGVVIVQRLARHARLDTTQRYAHPTEAELVQAANRRPRGPALR